MLYLVIFTVALGRSGRMVTGGIPFADFIAPGPDRHGDAAERLRQFLLLAAGRQGAGDDRRLSDAAALDRGADARHGRRFGDAGSFLVGLAVWGAMLLWPGVHVIPSHLWAVFWFGLMGSLMLSFLGLITSIWAEKFDHAAAVGNFVVTPLSLLSGTFYSIDSLSPTFQAISHANPFFYVISGFRFGFLGVADSPPWFGALLLLAINVALGAICYVLLRIGWKIKAMSRSYKPRQL